MAADRAYSCSVDRRRWQAPHVSTSDRLVSVEAIRPMDLRGLILVEGPSDKLAVETLARRRGRDLGAERISVVNMGGVTNLPRHLAGIWGEPVRVAGMCDAADASVVMRALAGVGAGSPSTTGELEELGFFVCVVDLEEELVRALGPEKVLRVFERDGRLHKFRTFQTQVEKRDLQLEVQIWDYLTNWKIHYAGQFVEALDLDRVPRPLDGVLSRV